MTDPRPLAQSDAEPERAQLRLEEDAQGKRAMLGGYQMPDALIPSLEAQSDAEPVRSFAKAVLHGDDEHKAWLLEAAEAFIAGNPLPAPRGKGTQQSNAGPVAWQYRWKPTQATGWTEWHSIPQEELGKYPNPIYETRCLYAGPPRPDASAGLIEAAEMADEEAAKIGGLEGWELKEFARLLRARAADRSGK